MEAVYTQNDRIWADIDGGGGDFQSPPIVAEGMGIAGRRKIDIIPNLWRV